MLYLNMPRKKVPCPQCGLPKAAESELCRRCRPTYERTPESRAKLSAALKGRRHSYRSGSTRPEIAAKIRDWWTPERKEARRLSLLERKPTARYHGLSSRRAAQLVRDAGRCQRCDHDGSESRLGIHHRDRNKKNQTPENLEVLCHRCHMREHSEHGETGWQHYHQKRKTTRC